MNNVLKILIVEDTPEDAELALLRLRSEGFQFEWHRVETKQEYLNELAKQPDLILADWSLPQFSGMKALKLMKEQTLDIPFVIVSGNIGEEAAVEAMREGAYDYVLKDRPDRLGQSIRNALEQKELRDIQKKAQIDLQHKTDEYQFLATASLHLPKLTTETDVFDYICECLPQIVPGIITIVMRVTPNAENLFIHKITGLESKLITKSFDLIGNDLMRLTFPLKYQYVDIMSNSQLNQFEGGFVDFTQDVIPATAAKNLQKFLKLEKIFTVGLASNANFFGGLLFLIPENIPEPNQSLIESFIQQCFMALAQIRSKSNLVQSEENFRQLAENIRETFWLNDPETHQFIYASPAFEELWGIPCDKLYKNRQKFLESIHPEDRERVKNIYYEITKSQAEMDIEHRILLPDNTERWIHTRAYPVLDENKEFIRIAGISEDISERIESMRLLLHSRDRLRRAEQVSQSGNWEFDLKSGMVHASRGARKIYGMESRVWTIEQIQKIPLLEHRPALDAAMNKLIEEKIPYDIEFWIRRPNDGKIIAIHSVAEYDASREVVFGIIQDITSRKLAEVAQVKAAEELRIAYDATIEGWSRAMDLRDKETEGHTQRVTEITLAMAKKMGINGDELLHVRRGALLHDIGKLGVPDAILHKPGPLSPEEWVIMKKHPEYAYEMLHSVEYLRPALDIPYCHHEKWDGSGYPRGLSKEEIPLSARIFSIIDVWDALTSDRPYRAAWTKEKTLKYIKEHSKIFFDPEIIPIFLEFIQKEN
jgi:PAS domain S-box-containing protein/putative nucleotidyltransferase with HDIG domain